MPFIHSYYYYITIALQAICVIHCMRKGNQVRWIWVIVFLPVVGALAYIFTEMTPGRGIQQVQSGIGMVFNPGGRIRRLEENLRFTDTFSNRVELADAYLAAGQTDKAVELYESSLTGTFIENEHVLIRLTTAYFEKKRYKDVIAVVRKIYKLPQFARSRSHLLYALALEHTGQFEMAEKEFRMMKARFSHFESRYHYAKFLQRAGRLEEAGILLNELVDESRHLSPQERRDSRVWVGKAKEELRLLPLQSKILTRTGARIL
jgi:hypothetical protein